jgi:Family of unknown function (DUF5752)
VFRGGSQGQTMDAFHFFTKLDQMLLPRLRASSINDFLMGIRSVPDTSIYFHTHRFLFQHHFLSPFLSLSTEGDRVYL